MALVTFIYNLRFIFVIIFNFFYNNMKSNHFFYHLYQNFINFNIKEKKNKLIANQKSIFLI